MRPHVSYCKKCSLSISVNYWILLLLTKGSMDSSFSSVSTQDYYDQDRHQEQYHYQDDGDQEHPKETTHSEATVINLIDSLNAGSWSTTRKRTFCFCDSSCLNHVNQKILERIPTMILLKSMGFAKKNISDVLRDMGNEKMKQNIEETVQQWCSTNNSDTISEESAATPTDRRKKRCTDMGVLKKSMKKKKKMDIKLKSLSELVDSKGSYVCKECNKVFDDFRALGGHTASHNRNKKAENAPSEELGTGGGDLDRGSSLAELAVDNKGKRYECGMCSRRFSTGQALGGFQQCKAECFLSLKLQAFMCGQRAIPSYAKSVSVIHLQRKKITDTSLTKRPTLRDETVQS
ncbi:hypothetical protein MANES_01G006800v8 [Manihot esculenta]|uniref:Uncharacterized protein n=1 Tax=Manihot esculenta TaxID=3983 RepID=A0ACB7I8T5_MANES|nr:hypothetical protein MANES_01G006800v8 [Manihot esculenta]